MASPFGLYKYAKYVYGINKFGKSAPAGDVIKDYRFTTEDVTNYILKILNK